MVFDGEVEAAKLELKKAQTAQNMSLDQLAELLQRLNDTEAKRQAEPDVFTLDDDDHTTVMPGADDTDPDDHESHENELWNEDLLKEYALDALNTLESSYPTPPETPSALLTDATYRIPTERDEDPHDTNFEPWKAAFAAGRLVQPEKLQTYIQLFYALEPNH